MRPLQGVGKDVVFRDGTFADKMEKFLIEYGGLDAETGISEQIEVSDAEAFDLRFTGNGSILRPESAFRRKYNEGNLRTVGLGGHEQPAERRPCQHLERHSGCHR